VKNTEEYIEELQEELEKARTNGAKKILLPAKEQNNEATSTDVPVINTLINEYGWKPR
jgi:hypothetical protein